VTVWREIRCARDLMGVAFVKRDAKTVRPLMVLADKEIQYGENFKHIKGVIMRGIVRVISRWHIWTIKKKEIEGGAFMYSDLEKAEMQKRARNAFQAGDKRPPLDLCK
jgi:hypothetical protein